MNQHLEIEFKQLLTKDQYLKILNYFNLKEDEGYLQTNYYFDTKERDIQQRRYSLRVRDKDHHYELTLKRPQQTGLMELNDFISLEEFNQFKQGTLIHPTLSSLQEEGIDTTQLSCLCHLETLRKDIEYKGGLLSIDRNRYLDNEDYEIEYESEDYDQGKAIFMHLMNLFDIDYKQNTLSKVKRTFNALENLEIDQAIHLAQEEYEKESILYDAKEVFTSLKNKYIK